MKPPSGWDGDWDSADARGHDTGPWTRWTTWAWQAAADPASRRPLPPQPAGGAAHVELIAFWSPLLHLTNYGLGWTDTGAGLFRWLKSGANVSDPRLAVIRRWWGDALPDLLAYAQGGTDLQALGAHVSQTVGAPTPRPPGRVAPNSDLARLVEQRRDDPGWQQVWSGGGDPLHLNFHSLTPVQPQPAPGAVVRLAIEQPGRAVLTTNRYDGWYSALAAHGTGLPPIGDGRSWRISVFCLPVGYLGTYRQSRDSGRWFAGRHRWHQLGT